MRYVVAAAVLLSGLLTQTASARTLEQIKASGLLRACLPVNVMPYSRREGSPSGFQVDLANALAKQLGVSLEKEWVISHIQTRHADCDLSLDVIADPEAQGETRLVLSKAYYRSGVALVSRPDHSLNALSDLNQHTKVAIQVASMAAMILGQRHVGLTTYAFEDEMLQAVEDGEADAAMVSPASAGYFNVTHPDHKLNIVLPKDADAEMAWNVAVGMRRPDKSFREAIDAAIDKFVADGTMASIYGRYGVTLAPPK
jgi:polar amino acid transport system substrate-binding protein